MTETSRRVTVGATAAVEIAAATLLAVLWIAPLLYAFWAAFHPAAQAVNFDLLAPLTLDNFAEAWSRAPFARYMANTVMLVGLILAGQFVLCTLAVSYTHLTLPTKRIV